MISFRLAETATGEPVVEVWFGDTFVASIYGHPEGVRLISKYYDGVRSEPGFPPGVVIKLSCEGR